MFDFKELILSKIKNMNSEYVDLVSGDIHREVGGYPGSNHRMPSCCNAIRDIMYNDDEVLYSPKKGNGATLKIRYYKKNHEH
ncbi:MAG: HNH endonuclease [Gammaproteobacteria bacterium]|jgi:5-methylcytosine-specific restriction protein A